MQVLMETPPVNPHHNPRIRQQDVVLLEALDVLVPASFHISQHQHNQIQSISFQINPSPAQPVPRNL